MAARAIILTLTLTCYYFEYLLRHVCKQRRHFEFEAIWRIGAPFLNLLLT